MPDRDPHPARRLVPVGDVPTDDSDAPDRARTGGGWRSWRSRASVLSAGSFASVLSAGSALSAGSFLSIGSAGSVLSIGSAGSVLSIGSSGSVLSIGASGGFAQIGRGPAGPVGPTRIAPLVATAATSTAALADRVGRSLTPRRSRPTAVRNLETGLRLAAQWARWRPGPRGGAPQHPLVSPRVR